MHVAVPDQSRRTLQVTAEHLAATRTALAALHPPNDALLVDGAIIDRLADRAGDRYVWHVEPGSAYRESSLLRLRIDEARIDPDARLAHGALGLIYALHTALALDPALPIVGIQDVGYAVPIFEGAHIAAMIEPPDGELGAFAVTSDQFEPNLAINGKIVYGPIWQGHDSRAFVSLAEQQLFTLEEAIGVVSALIGSWAQDSGGRALYRGQRLELRSLLSSDDTLVATGEVVDRRPGHRIGERITARIMVASTRTDATIASGESVFLYSYGSDGL